MTDFVVQERTLGQILDEAAARFPDREALVYADRDYRQTWREFSDLSLIHISEPTRP